MIVAKGIANSRKIEINVLSRREMEDEKVGAFGKHIVISITDPKQGEARIKTAPKAILRLQFHDLDKHCEGYEIFTDKDAKKVRRFVTSHLNEIETIVIHCEAGVSRSVGMGAAIAKFYFNDDTVFFDRGIPNKLIYGKVLQEFQKKAEVKEETVA